MGMMAGLGALAGGIYGAVQGSPASNVQMPQMWQMPNQGAAAGGALSGIGGLSGYNTWNIPEARQVTSRLFNNPYAAGFQQGGNFAGGMGQLGALSEFGTGQAISGYGTNQLPAWATSIANAGMDPQQALYQRTLQQVRDQTGAAGAATGTGMTPYGAGVQNKALSDFNIDWQNNQLNRMIAGGGAASNIMGQGGSLAQLGQGMMQQAPLNYLNASGIPYGTFAGIGAGQMGALTGLGQFGQNASTLQQQQIQDYLNYINAGTGATNAATGVGQLGLNQAGMGFGQNLANLGLGLYGAGQIGGRGYGMPGFGSSSGWGQSVFGPGGWNYQ